MRLTFEDTVGNDTVYLDVLKAICGETSGKSMADLGCNKAPHTPKLGFEKRVYVDVLDRTLDHAEEQQYFVKYDMINYLNESPLAIYDVCISSDSIEHLSERDGERFVEAMKKHSLKQVIFTPLGEWMMDKEGVDPEGHHSLWTPEMLPDFAAIVFKSYHPTLGIGAWFGFRCENIEQEFQRVSNELKQKSWARN